MRPVVCRWCGSTTIHSSVRECFEALPKRHSRKFVCTNVECPREGEEVELDDVLTVLCEDCDMPMQILPIPGFDGLFLSDEECRQLYQFIMAEGYVGPEMTEIHSLLRRLERFS